MMYCSGNSTVIHVEENALIKVPFFFAQKKSEEAPPELPAFSVNMHEAQIYFGISTRRMILNNVFR